MFYIIIYVTLKIDGTWELSLFSCFLNSITSTFMLSKPNNFEQTNKIVFYFEKVKNIMFCKDK